MKSDADAIYLDEALKLGQKAFLKQEVPIGAVVVQGGKIIGRGYNQTHHKQDVTYHAEIVALRQAQKQMGDWRLEGAKLYVTVEPCLMCLGAALLARVQELHFVLDDATFGSVHSVLKLTNKGAYKNLKFVQHSELEGDVEKLMKQFFSNLRKIKK